MISRLDYVLLHIAIFQAMVVLLLGCANKMSEKLITMNDLQPPANGMEGEFVWSKTVTIGPGITYDATLEVTPKGNGVFRMANLRLMVLDSHNDGAMYKNRLLGIWLQDLNGDGYKDLDISGQAQWYPEKGDHAVDSESVNFTYTYDPSMMEFVKTQQTASFALEDGPSPRP